MLNKDIVKLVEEIKNTIKPNISISTAESCTGGMLASYLTEIPGSSEYFSLGIVSYSNAAKIKLLSVQEKTLNKFGAVSEEVAKEMAIGSRNISDSNIAISVTGIAGPGGGTELKPIGTVCFGLVDSSRTHTITHYFKGSRTKIRQQVCRFALQMILDSLGV